MAEDKSQKKNPGESFAEMFKEFGAAMGEIFNDPKLKEKAKEFGESASASAKTFAARFKDEEVKNKFKDFGQAAKKFGESMSEYFKEDKSKSEEKKENQNNSNNATEASSDSEDESKKKLNNRVNTSTTKNRDHWDRDRWDRDHWRRGKHSRESRIAGYSFSIAWSLILIIFFNYFNRYIAYYTYSEAAGKWNIQPLITGDFKAWLPILTIALTISIIGNIILIINDSFYVRNIALIVMNIFGIASVITLLTLFPFDFSIIPSANWNAILFPIIKIVLILIIIGIAIGSFVRFIKIIVHIARNDSGTLQE